MNAPATGAVRLDPVWDDPAAVLELIRSAGPYPPLAAYAATDAERKAAGGKGAHGFVPPWFRADIAALGEVLVPGGESMLHNPRFIEAAQQVFGGQPLVDPTTVYVNVMGPCDYPFGAHTDVAVFRGRTRRNTPPWLLILMHSSGLFEAERIKVATAVSWFFDGPGGDFWYWPDGPDGEPVVEAAPFDNVAVVADNETTFHGVAPVGETDAPSLRDLTLAAEIVWSPEGWTVTDGPTAEERAPAVTYPDASVRITTSWKGEIFADEAARDFARSGQADLSIDAVVDRLCAGVDVDRPDDPLNDEAWIDTVSEAFPRPRLRISR